MWRSSSCLRVSAVEPNSVWKLLFIQSPSASSFDPRTTVGAGWGWRIAVSVTIAPSPFSSLITRSR